jgi:hypothetical protein
MRASSADRLGATRSVSGLTLVRPRDRFKDQQRRLVNKVQVASSMAWHGRGKFLHENKSVPVSPVGDQQEDMI